MKFGVVIVTYNRLELLKRALSLYDEQRDYIDYVIVVDNHSTDLTGAYLDTWTKDVSKYRRIVISEPSNIGGSGGFHDGLKASLLLDSEWIWVADDDAMPYADTFAEANNFITGLGLRAANTSAVCAAVHRSDGEIEYGHRALMYKNGRKVVRESLSPTSYADPCTTFNCYSFVGTFLRKGALKKAGLPKRKYFIWYDDTEHSLRMSKKGTIYLAPKIRVLHLDPVLSDEISWKSFYGMRNNGDLIRKHFGILCYVFYWHWQFQSARGLPSSIMRREVLNMTKSAFWGSVLHIFGIHRIYKPGWTLRLERMPK